MNIKISEHFHSIQGEGRTTGSQAVFLRLQSCNLMCGGYGTQRDQKLHDGATWRCDTIEVWKEGISYTVDKAVAMIVRKYGAMLKAGSHLIITGGEPLLQEDEIIKFLLSLRIALDGLPFIEMETNGTLKPSSELSRYIDLYNVSFKLKNSGMPLSKRIKEDPLRFFTNLTYMDRAIFKVVVKDQEDVDEAREILHAFKPSNHSVYLMPACSNIEEWEAIKNDVAHLSKTNNFHFSPRLQIVLWNQTTGV